MKKRLWTLLTCLMCLTFVGCEVGEDEQNQEKSNTYKVVKIDGETYYQMTGKYEEEYFYDTFGCYMQDSRYAVVNDDPDKLIDLDSDEYESLRYGVICDYDDYEELCEKYYITQEYEDEDSNYIVVLFADTNSWVQFEPVAIEYDGGDTVYYYYYEDWDGVMASGNGFVCVIPTDIDTDIDVHMISCINKEEAKNLKKYGTKYDPDFQTVDKPVIYLYPVEDNTAVDVSLELTNAKLTCTYPSYDDGWSVIANRDGLIKAGGKEYSYLYWEGESCGLGSIEQGFCVKGSETADFLEEKLAELGLNRREANEFIVYWLPLMEKNEYNVISFDTTEYEAKYKLHVNPAPDTMIRVFMTWYGTDEAVDIEPQIIETPSREGFTVVEWGGSQIK